jgi:hypothetical protein
MSRQNDACSLFFWKVATSDHVTNELPDFTPRNRIDTGATFVQKDNLWLTNGSTSKGQATFHTTTVSCTKSITILFTQADFGQFGGSRFLDRPSRDTLNLGV